jgi:hypothetical protein
MYVQQIFTLSTTSAIISQKFIKTELLVLFIYISYIRVMKACLHLEHTVAKYRDSGLPMNCVSYGFRNPVSFFIKNIYDQ